MITVPNAEVDIADWPIEYSSRCSIAKERTGDRNRTRRKMRQAIDSPSPEISRNGHETPTVQAIAIDIKRAQANLVPWIQCIFLFSLNHAAE